MLQIATYQVVESLRFRDGLKIESPCSKPFHRWENAELCKREMEDWAERNSLPFRYEVKEFDE